MKFSNCADFTTDFSVDEITVRPNPVMAGQQFTFVITGRASSTLTDGAKLQILVTLGGIPVWTDNLDLCALSAAAGSPCPIAPGRQTLTIPVTLTDLPPFVVAEVTIETTNGDGTLLFCVTGTLPPYPDDPDQSPPVPATSRTATMIE